MWMFQSHKTQFLSISKSKSFHDSNATSQRFATWICDSWALKNYPLCGTSMHILKFSQPENTFPEHQQTNPLLDSTEHILRFARWKLYSWASANRPSCRMVLFLWDRFAVWKCQSRQSANRLPCSSAPSLSEIFAAWKQDYWISADRPPTRTALPTFERFEARKRDSW